nr:MAG TPA: hypothetical protein [Bacteriophage sp.]
MGHPGNNTQTTILEKLERCKMPTRAEGWF